MDESMKISCWQGALLYHGIGRPRGPNLSIGFAGLPRNLKREGPAPTNSNNV
jgi:hypothetical protein